MAEQRRTRPAAPGLDGRRRAEAFAAAAGRRFDLVVVGGGINGAGVARDAALRGLDVCLVEMRDLGFGTSSRSSKLIHGGLRYLEHYQLKLVFESTNERATLRHIAPHLVRPLSFAMPVYESSSHPLWKLDLGLWLYDGLSLFKAERRHLTVRSPRRMLEREPLLNPDGLTGGLVYYDCITDDARLTLENAMSAADAGAVVLSHARVSGLDVASDRGGIRVELEDALDGQRHVLRARGAVNATGVWTDRTRGLAGHDARLIRPTKGVHVVVDRERLPVQDAVALASPDDGRVFFAIPWGGRTVLGTTDTDDRTDPSRLTIERSDVDYLLRVANLSFPAAELGVDDVLAGWVGLRPLIHADVEKASDVPREHQLVRDGRLLTVAGGKLTTYRRMAAEVVDAAASMIGASCQETETDTLRLPGAVGLDDVDDVARDLVETRCLPDDVARRLADAYGQRAWDVAACLDADASLADRVSPDRPVIFAEVVHAVEHELALALDDVLVRRTSIALTARDRGLPAAARAAELMGARLGWSAARVEAEQAAYREEIARSERFRGDGAG
jgi:glycerol-3-phosphate dehydrogenase